MHVQSVNHDEALVKPPDLIMLLVYFITSAVDWTPLIDGRRVEQQDRVEFGFGFGCGSVLINTLQSFVWHPPGVCSASATHIHPYT